ncbi:MAG: hypothetical protein ACU85V_19300, partial [Gammaproteobacteria bacterium]
PQLGPAARRELKALAQALDARAGELGVPSSVLATRKELALVVGGAVPARLADGWRARVLAPVLG